ncbi:hypothetical protein Tdes44962_MAKER05201 [Teratosphaeria destructans]|uniref:Uncharacterized protein n=1 Tax=Teratosphaeria destructans TaxID=418781 RepID=A0A9W7VZ24_9PEZI|nr:hypothetical protein Tdes44962_MAKER05201 [Teratosphaeria destructans]
MRPPKVPQRPTHPHPENILLQPQHPRHDPDVIVQHHSEQHIILKPILPARRSLGRREEELHGARRHDIEQRVELHDGIFAQVRGVEKLVVESSGVRPVVVPFAYPRGGLVDCILPQELGLILDPIRAPGPAQDLLAVRAGGILILCFPHKNNGQLHVSSPPFYIMWVTYTG